jgi:hypothetical protein
MEQESVFDNAKANAFAGKLLEILNGGCLSLMISVGHKTGLFDTLSVLQSPGTSEEIAEKANLNERYVREWLGGMVVGGIVEYFPNEKTYLLPPEHSAFTTRAAGIDNLALFSQYYKWLQIPLQAKKPRLYGDKKGDGENSNTFDFVVLRI